MISAPSHQRPLLYPQNSLLSSVVLQPSWGELQTSFHKKENKIPKGKEREGETLVGSVASEVLGRQKQSRRGRAVGGGGVAEDLQGP